MLKCLFTVLFGLFFIAISQANIIVLNGLTHYYATTEGGVYKGKVEIHNAGSTSKDVKLFQQDLSYDDTGAIFYTEPNSNKYSNSKWISLSTNILRLAGNEKAVVNFEIVVPSNSLTGGSYWSTIIVEPVDDFLEKSNNNSVQIKSIVRYAIQIITDYNTNGVSADILFKKISLDKSNEQKNLRVALANNGRLYCKTKVLVELYNVDSGQKIDGTFESQSLSLLPNTSKSFLVDVSKIPSGIYKAIAFAKDENENAFALEFDLEI